MAGAIPSNGLIQTASPDEVDASMRAKAADQGSQPDDIAMTQLAGEIRRRYDVMRNHRNSLAGWNDRLLEAQRTFNGEYSAQKLAQIQQFGGSSVYTRVTAEKCRGASSLLREVYLGADRPWGLEATPEPTLPDDIMGSIKNLVTVEVQSMSQAGQPLDAGSIRDRVDQLMQAAQLASKRKAREQARSAEDQLDDFLVEGEFYTALAEFLIDLPIFPFACLKGPVVRIVPDVVWAQGKAVVQNKAKMFWQRVSPFDVYFTPGVSDIRDADVIERTRLTRADLNDLLDVPGYNQDELRAVLDEYGRGGLVDWMDPTDAERAINENRENPTFNQSGMIDCLEFHGNVQGRMLLDYGFEDGIKDELRDYFVQCWQIGRHVIKVQIAPSPRKRHPYYITSFEKVPGTPVGNALPDILGDVQEVCNATLRALVNNLSISSGPQVVVNDDRIAPGQDGDELYPWKRWHVTSDPMSNVQGQKPIDFFQPNSNAQELLGVYEKFTQIADELSAIPRYITGSGATGSAGRTASGLAMLMGNASKLLQTVAANVDRDVIAPLLQSLYDMVMLTDQSGLFRGDEAIRVRGVDVAVQRETDRQRQIEFLQATMNPVDSQIIGTVGRAKVLRSVAGQIGLDGDDIVPTDDELKQQMQQAQQAQAMQAQLMAAQGVGPDGKPITQPGKPGTGITHPAALAQGAQTPGPANTGLGIQDASAMRGMAG